MFKAPTKPGMEPFHELLKGLTGGSYIQYEENDEGKLITKREAQLPETSYTKQTITKQ